jgi:cation-transporting ATPase 13A3/4/5
MKQPAAVFAVLCLCFLPSSVKADWGDHADFTFQCPALTTCPLVCVANATLCPESLLCDDGQELCTDGTCSPLGEPCDGDLESPCEHACAPIACRRDIVNYYASCSEDYQVYYDAVAECVEEEEARMYTFREPGFGFCYAWISVVTTLMLAWCAFNQRLAPVNGSTKEIKIPATVEGRNEASGDDPNSTEGTMMTQTAYYHNIIGRTIYVWVILTIVGFHIILFTLVLLYYHQQAAISGWSSVFEDEQQVLLAFEITWMIGFVWSFALKWPKSISSLFLRRCQFQNASCVAVFAPFTNRKYKQVDTGSNKRVKDCLSSIGDCFNSIMAFVFSDTTPRRSKDGWEIKFCKVSKDAKGNKYFTFRMRRYIYDAEKDLFVPGEWPIVEATTIDKLCIPKGINTPQGLDREDIEKRSLLIGPNHLEMPKPSFLRTVQQEFSGPFYTYQCFFIWSWLPLWYYYMALIWACIVLSGGFATAYFKYRNKATLYKLTKVEGDVQVFREDGQSVNVSFKDLVPGDVVVLKPGITYADMLVLKSTSLIVDESSLTGESNPVAKTAVTSEEVKYDIHKHKKHTILSGTTILESSGTEGDLGLVIKTGSFTSKGEMLRDILSYERHHFKFDTEVKVVLLILLVWACIAFAITVHLIQDTPIYGWFYGIYVFAAALPPLLPTVFVISVGMSEERLSQKGITCVNNQSILIAGKVKKALFDKTGTLTKQGLDYNGARIYSEAGEFEKLTMEVNPQSKLAMAMASCHTLAQTSSGKIIGNTVDEMMFLASKATMEQLNTSAAGSEVKEESDMWNITLDTNVTLKVLKRYEFDHHRQAQSVVVQTPDGKTIAFVKGSAESIKEKSRSDALPPNFDDVINNCAREGIYQISIASKEIDGDYSKMTREDIECDLSFLGLVDFKNNLRAESPYVIMALENGDVQSIMVTGDNVFTGVCIAKECGMIKKEETVAFASSISDSGKVSWTDEYNRSIILDDTKKVRYALAMTGSIWSSLCDKNHDAAMSLVDQVVVFGRCTPNDKVSVVSALNEKGFITSMCGDGGNDCGALKTAHVGIALSDAEASVVSPFTSLDKSITSTLDVLLEGRCALANAISSYKYMLMYGQVETVNQMACAYFQITFSEWCWVFLDGVWMVTMAFSIPRSKAATTLAPERPSTSLLGLHTTSSFLGVFFLNLTFLCIALAVLFRQDWFSCRMWGSTDVSNVLVIGDNYESTVIFLVTGYQYITSAVAYNFGYSFRAAWYKNWVLVLLATIYTIIHFLMTLTESTLSCFFRVNCSNDNVEKLGPTLLTYLTGNTEPFPIQNPFNTTVMPMPFRWTLVIIMVANTVTICAYDYFVVNTIGKKVARDIKNKKKDAGLVKGKVDKEHDEKAMKEEGHIEQPGAKV